MLLNEFTLQGSEMQMDVSALLLLQVSTLQGPELHLDVSACTKEECTAPGGVYTTGA